MPQHHAPGKRPTLPLPAVAGSRLLPPKTDPPPRSQTAEPPHQRSGRSQTRGLWPCPSKVHPHQDLLQRGRHFMVSFHSYLIKKTVDTMAYYVFSTQFRLGSDLYTLKQGLR